MNRKAKVLLVLALVVVVGMAFRVSWNALRDVAETVGADSTAATLYPFVVDGLMALALVATLALTGRDRTFALRVLAGYTLASLVLNYVHGLVPEMHGGNSGIRLADWEPANWALVLLATSLPVGSIFFGSDLVAKVLHHRPATDETAQSAPERSVVDVREPVSRAAVESGEQVPDPEPTDQPTAPPKARRTTGPVPPSARTRRPTRTPAELLAEARTASRDWSDAELTADRIRTAVHTSAANARSLRDALKAERAERNRLHLVAAEAVGGER